MVRNIRLQKKKKKKKKKLSKINLILSLPKFPEVRLGNILNSNEVMKRFEVFYYDRLWIQRSCHSRGFEPLHDKTNKMSVRPAKTQISLGIRVVWSESSLSAWRKPGSWATHWAHNEDWSDWADAQADLSLRWAHTHFVGFVMTRLICSSFPFYE